MAAIGMMVTLRSLLPIFIAMPVGQLIDSVGSMKMLKFGCVFLVLSLFTNMMASDIWMLAISQLLMGTCIIIMASSFQVMVSEGGKAERNENIKTYSMWMSAGGMFGPLIGGLVVSQFAAKMAGYKFAFGLACAVSAAFLLVLAVAERHYRKPDHGDRVNPKELLKLRGIVNSYASGIHLTKSRAVQFGLIGTFLIMYIQVLYMSFMPIYLDELGYATLIISAVISVQGLAGMLSRYALGWVMRRTNLERILISAGFVAAACLAFTPVASLHTFGLFTLVIVMGAAVGINLPVSMMIMVNDTADSDRGKLMGLRLLMNRFSQTISPAIFGVLGQTVGLTFAFYAGGAVLLATMFGFSMYASLKLGVKTEAVSPTRPSA